MAVDPVPGVGQDAADVATSAWTAVFGERPTTSGGLPVMVVLRAPSLADRMAASEVDATAEEQKRWVSEADAGQRLLIARLASRGVAVRRERSFTRTLNAFSARVDAKGQAALARDPAVAGVYPVRTVYPASVTTRVLTRPEFRPGAGRRPDLGLPGFDGAGLEVALLDSGVDIHHPFLDGRVLPGIDIVDRDRRAAAEPKPDDQGIVESHGTRMAGVLVGDDGPSGLEGVAPGARVLPIRILGWERAEDGSYALLGRGDALLAGLERAVDPDGDGSVEDAAEIALAAVVEPYASFADSPEARAVAGASRLGTLVVAPAGNDGRGGSGFGTVGAPGGAAAALTVGALDARRDLLDAQASIQVGGDEAVASRVPVLGSLAPAGEFPATALVGPTLAEPGRARTTLADGSVLADYFDTNGLSTVAGRAVVLPGDGGGLEARVRNAVTAGAAAVLVAGTSLPPGSLDLDETSAIPVVGISLDAARAALAGILRGEVVSVSFSGVGRTFNPRWGLVAAFSSGGIGFGGQVKPEVVAPGVGIATADGGMNADGSPRYATATGSSVAAAVTAGAAAVLAQARPGLSVADLRSLLVGSARQLVRDGAPEPVTVQGAGVVDPVAAAAAEIAVHPATLAYGRADRDGWHVTQTVTIQSLTTRPLEIGFGLTRDRWGAPEISFSASPAHVSLRPGASAEVLLLASGTAPLAGEAGGAFVVSPQGSRPVRVPWAVSFRSERAAPLLTSVVLSQTRFAPSDTAPAVLSFRAGAVAPGGSGAVEPVQFLVAELWTGSGRRLGMLTRLRDLLPGRYAFGVTGRGPRGKALPAGAYVLRLRAQPVDGDSGARATTVDVPFTIARGA
ncbi:MAG: S8 family serine peptidase [Actinomycetota bacterium]|nr:S8 family serine peptidase [Actinomycetota bacterium]